MVEVPTMLAGWHPVLRVHWVPTMLRPPWGAGSGSRFRAGFGARRGSIPGACCARRSAWYGHRGCPPPTAAG